MIKTVETNLKEILNLPELDQRSNNGDICDIGYVARVHMEYLKTHPDIDYSEKIPCNDNACGFVTVGELLGVN